MNFMMSMKRAPLVVLLVLFTAFLSHGTLAQTRDELERQKESLEREIRITSQLLTKTRETAEASVGQLTILNNQISRRENLVGTIQNEIRLINRRIATLTSSVEELENDLEELKESYARMIRHAARNQDTMQRLMFIFSSSDFNQAYMRLRYLQQYGRHRRKQADKIQDTQARLEKQIATLEEERVRQQELLHRQRDEVRELAREKTSQEQAVEELRTREQELRRQLREQERQAQALQDEIRRVIEEERRRARERAEAEGRETTDMFAMTPEEQLISDNFAGNRGSLPWPVERGVITGRFGQQAHPVLPGIQISNNGIDISTAEGSPARAIFEGNVSRVISVPGGFYAVIIRHGEYLSVYSNLSEVFVRNGQDVDIREEIGVVGTNRREAKTTLHLEIWQGNDKQNPEAWIARGN